MMRSHPSLGLLVRSFVAAALFAAIPWLPASSRGEEPAQSGSKVDVGVLPTDAKGNPLNLDFETGTLKDWTATGTAFPDRAVAGDTVAARRSDMKSKHAGKYWINSFDRAGDRPVGTLTSRSFRVTKPFAKFLVAGGLRPTSRVELVRNDTGAVFFHIEGDDTEELKPVVVDLTGQMNREIFIRLVDEFDGGWGHVNFDDFKLYDKKPIVPASARPSAADVFAHEGLAPLDAAKAMTLPEGFHVQLFAGEPDVVQPIAQAIDDRGRLWVAEAYSYPIRVPDNQAKDRILIFEDKDGDGRFDTRKIFVDKLNLVSGLAIGFGGVWVGAAPHLLFIPDQNGDDVPDGPAKILLDGWHSEDTHETLNSFAWGPDGRLYGCHGVFTHSRVGKPGAADSDRIPINAGIWRYHPTKHVFEVFAHGTSNPWGVDFNREGQAFLTSCVIPHLYHVIQGARYERQAGPHFNQYTYDDIKTIADHRHYLGANPHAGNGRSESAGGGHAHAGAAIYQGYSWPKEYVGSIFMNNIHGARINRDVLHRARSGFVGSHAADFIMANDRWSQIVNLQFGPGDSLYMIDWYDKNQCHHFNVDGHDRTNGRIFRVTYGDHKPPQLNLASLSSIELASKLADPDSFVSRHALRLLQERGRDAATAQVLEKTLAQSTDETARLRALWGLYVIGEPVDPARIDYHLEKNEYLRAWTIQLGTQDGASVIPLDRLVAAAESDPSPVVRLYLASAAGRMSMTDRPRIVAALAAHREDATDQNLPLMIWYAAEPLAEVDPAHAIAIAERARIPLLLPYMARRIGAIGTPEAIGLLVDRAGAAADLASRRSILEGLEESLKGRRRIDVSKERVETIRRLAESPDERVRSLARSFAVLFGDPQALKALRENLINLNTPLNVRNDSLAALLNARDPELGATLIALLDDATIRAKAIRSLASYDDPQIPAALVERYERFTADERRDVLNTLAARLDSARVLMTAVESKRIAAKDLTADVIRQLRNHKNKQLDEQIARSWGAARETSADKKAEIARYKKLLSTPARPPADVMLGRSIFVKTCSQCHTLFGVGGKVGPELTGSNRADLDYVLSNVLDPSALIGKDYQAQIVSTKDGRVLTGIIRGEDKRTITVVSANDIITVPKSEIDERRVSDESMMPIDIWKPLSEHEIRSLVAYLASPSQTPLLATRDNAPGFFNERDLKGWEGDHTLWTVENGEIVGKTAGLNHNEFLRSELAAADFRLRLKVKLVDNAGNSGVQFRSEAGPNGEIAGYQADIGVGWWGKLYEENGRGLLWDRSGEAYVKPNDWNDYEIVAIGGRIRTYINGKLCVDLNDTGGAKRGIFAIQLHAGGPTEVRIRDVRLEPDPKID